MLFKTPVTANEGLAKLRDVVNNNKRLGNFTVEALKIIQPVNPTTATSTEGSTGTYVTRARRVISVKNDMDIRELLQSRHRWQQERQESNRFNKNNKKNTSTLQVNKKDLFTSFPTLHGYVKFPDAIFY